MCGESHGPAQPRRFHALVHPCQLCRVCTPVHPGRQQRRDAGLPHQRTRGWVCSAGRHQWGGPVVRRPLPGGVGVQFLLPPAGGGHG